MRLLEAVKESGLTSLSVIGMAKNAGKTVTLNHLIDDAYSMGMLLGLTSIGRDGEALDLVTKTDKPTIYVYENTLIATAESLFDQGTATMEILHMSDHHTAMGRIVIAKVHHEGYVQLAGPATNSGIQSIIGVMHRLGAQLVLVDGALDRTSLASPAVTGATVLATGAVLSRDMENVLQQTAHKVALLQTPQVNQSLRSAMYHATSERKIGIAIPGAAGDTVKWLDLKTALGAGKRIGAQVTQMTSSTLENTQGAGVPENQDACSALKNTFILLPGSLVASMVQDFLAVRGTLAGITWVVQDATKVFIEARDYLQLKRFGFNLRVMQSINLMGVTVNPTAPQGYAFEAEAFKVAMAAKIAPVSVFDVYLEDALWTF